MLKDTTPHHYATGENSGPVPTQRRSNAAASQLMTDTAARGSMHIKLKHR